jgi:hypothetical protein
MTSPEPQRSDAHQSGAWLGERAQTSGGFDTALPRCFFDASLLFRFMDMLQIDRRQLAKDEPLLFRELQGVCALCRSKEECVQDLADQFADMHRDKWRVYCPNSAMLTAIGAMRHGCGAAPRVDVPDISAVSHLG